MEAKLIPKKQIIDERGKIMQMMRNDDENFTKFGENILSYSHKYSKSLAFT